MNKRLTNSCPRCLDLNSNFFVWDSLVADSLVAILLERCSQQKHDARLRGFTALTKTTKRNYVDNFTQNPNLFRLILWTVVPYLLYLVIPNGMNIGYISYHTLIGVLGPSIFNLWSFVWQGWSKQGFFIRSSQQLWRYQLLPVTVTFWSPKRRSLDLTPVYKGHFVNPPKRTCSWKNRPVRFGFESISTIRL